MCDRRSPNRSMLYWCPELPDLKHPVRRLIGLPKGLLSLLLAGRQEQLLCQAIELDLHRPNVISDLKHGGLAAVAALKDDVGPHVDEQPRLVVVTEIVESASNIHRAHSALSKRLSLVRSLAILADVSRNPDGLRRVTCDSSNQERILSRLLEARIPILVQDGIESIKPIKHLGQVR